MFPINVCGTIYPYPNVGENPWGIEHIAWAIAVSNCVTANNVAIQNIISGGTFANPMTTDGDLIYQNLGLPDRLGVGFDSQILTLSAGLPSWQNAPSGGLTPLYATTTSSLNFGTDSGTYVDVTNLTETIVTTGNPVEITFQADDSGLGTINIVWTTLAAGVSSLFGDLQITRDGVPISIIPIRTFVDGTWNPEGYTQYIPPSSISFIDTPAAGTYEYKLQAKTTISDHRLDVYYTQMVLKTYV